MEGWGEQPLPEHQGATQGTPQELEQEQKQPEEQRDRELEQGVGVEGEQENMERMGSRRIPEEQSLIQLRMTGFLNPASHRQGWPSMENQTARREEDKPSATKNSSRGSPSGGGGVAIYLDKEEDEHFASGSGEAVLNNEHSNGVEESLPVGMDDRDDVNVGGMTPNDCVSDQQTETSVDDMGKLGPPMRKQDQVLGAVCDSVTDNGKIECTFRRGGVCNIHEVRGTRKLDSMKVWTKKKIGLFGYAWKNKVKYVCQYSGVAKPVRLESQDSGIAKSNDVFRDTGQGKKTKEYTALGGQTDTTGDVLWVCRADYRRAGS